LQYLDEIILDLLAGNKIIYSSRNKHSDNVIKTESDNKFCIRVNNYIHKLIAILLACMLTFYVGTCYLDAGTGSGGCGSSQVTVTRISFDECRLNSTNNFFSFTGRSSSCTPCNSVG